ncbi:protein PAXX [Brachyhypopomus gauderio]|uniref:protein PAXX n=1 Tax=Brachyhypopomus gauderio TaxID=698409 RepID=UPI004043819C
MDLAVLCILIDRNDKSKYVCFTRKKPEEINVGLSNGEDVWKADLSEDLLPQTKRESLLKSTEDYVLKLKGACQSGSAFVSLQEHSVVVHLGPDPADLNMPFTKLPDLEGRTEIKDLLFKMADSLLQWDRTGSSSPMKNPPKRSTAFEPRKQHQGPTIAVRKRLPGDSLINPGTRRKRAATGVDFDDGDDA